MSKHLLKYLPDLCIGQAESLKWEGEVDGRTFRVWLCRVTGGVSAEVSDAGVWRTLEPGVAIDIPDIGLVVTEV